MRNLFFWGSGGTEFDYRFFSSFIGFGKFSMGGGGCKEGCLPACIVLSSLSVLRPYVIFFWLLLWSLVAASPSSLGRHSICVSLQAIRVVLGN